MDDREPLVDSGMIEVALVIAAAGFLLVDLKGALTMFTGVAVTTFLLSGTGAFILYFVYLLQWMERHTYERFRQFLVLEAHTAVLATLVAFFGMALQTLGTPVPIVLVVLLIGFVLCGYMLTKLGWDYRNARQKQRPPGSSRGPQPTDDDRPIIQRDDVIERIPGEAEEDRRAVARPMSQQSSRSTHLASRPPLRDRSAALRADTQDETQRFSSHDTLKSNRRTEPSGRTETGHRRRTPDVEEH